MRSSRMRCYYESSQFRVILTKKDDVLDLFKGYEYVGKVTPAHKKLKRSKQKQFKLNSRDSSTQSKTSQYKSQLKARIRHHKR